jgi:hypothetical protein
MVGNITSHSLDDHNAVEIEFADAKRKTIRFTDQYR